MPFLQKKKKKNNNNFPTVLFMSVLFSVFKTTHRKRISASWCLIRSRSGLFWDSVPGMFLHCLQTHCNAPHYNAVFNTCADPEIFMRGGPTKMVIFGHRPGGGGVQPPKNPKLHFFR